MPTHDFKNIGEVLDFEILKGTITAIDSATDTCTVDVAGSIRTALIFYHCKPDSIARSNGAIEGAAAGFKIDDEVMVMIRSDNSVIKVIGHIDGVKSCVNEKIVYKCMAYPQGLWWWGNLDNQVYVDEWKAENDNQPFVEAVLVWDVAKNAPYIIETKPVEDGEPEEEPVIFPCNWLHPTFQRWLGEQTSVGTPLLLGYLDEVGAGEHGYSHELTPTYTNLMPSSGAGANTPGTMSLDRDSNWIPTYYNSPNAAWAAPLDTETGVQRLVYTDVQYLQVLGKQSWSDFHISAYQGRWYGGGSGPRTNEYYSKLKSWVYETSNMGILDAPSPRPLLPNGLRIDVTHDYDSENHLLYEIWMIDGKFGGIHSTDHYYNIVIKSTVKFYTPWGLLDTHEGEYSRIGWVYTENPPAISSLVPYWNGDEFLQITPITNPDGTEDSFEYYGSTWYSAICTDAVGSLGNGWGASSKNCITYGVGIVYFKPVMTSYFTPGNLNPAPPGLSLDKNFNSGQREIKIHTNIIQARDIESGEGRDIRWFDYSSMSRNFELETALKELINYSHDISHILGYHVGSVCITPSIYQ